MPDKNDDLKPTLKELAWIVAQLPFSFPKNGIEILITSEAGPPGNMYVRRYKLVSGSIIQLAIHPLDWRALEREAVEAKAITRDCAHRVDTIYGIKIRREATDEKTNDVVDAFAFALRKRFGERRGLHLSAEGTSAANHEDQQGRDSSTAEEGAAHSEPV